MWEEPGDSLGLKLGTVHAGPAGLGESSQHFPNAKCVSDDRMSDRKREEEFIWAYGLRGYHRHGGSLLCGGGSIQQLIVAWHLSRRQRTWTGRYFSACPLTTHFLQHPSR